MGKIWILMILIRLFVFLYCQNLGLNIIIDNDWKFKHNKIILVAQFGNHRIRIVYSEETSHSSIVIIQESNSIVK